MSIFALINYKPDYGPLKSIMLQYKGLQRILHNSSKMSMIDWGFFNLLNNKDLWILYTNLY